MTTPGELRFECKLEAPPEKVWRALTVPAYLDRWLNLKTEQLDLSVLQAEENKSLTYRWRESGQGADLDAEDSVVTFELTRMADGGTWFQLTHAPVTLPVAANANVAMSLAA